MIHHEHDNEYWIKHDVRDILSTRRTSETAHNELPQTFPEVYECHQRISQKLQSPAQTPEPHKCSI